MKGRHIGSGATGTCRTQNFQPRRSTRNSRNPQRKPVLFCEFCGFCVECRAVWRRRLAGRAPIVGVESPQVMREVVLPPRPIRLAVALCGFMAFALTTSGQVAPDRLADLEGAITAAESALRDG